MKKKLIVLISLMILVLPLTAGWVEKGGEGQTIINLKLYDLPDSSRTDTPTLANVAVVDYFKSTFPEVFKEKYAEKYKANPKKYGAYDWDNVEIRLHKFSGISLSDRAMDSGPLMAIAGGVSPDVIYVNFRQSDTYIQSGFLYPLDKTEDGYLTGLTDEEKSFAIHPRIKPVIERKGPGGQHTWMFPSGGLLGKVVAYRKDLLEANDIEFPTADWTWDDFFENCKKLTNPEQGTYGVVFSSGTDESWHWVTFLWSAGGEIMAYNPVTDTWKAVFDGPDAAVALDFYTRLCTEHWVDDEGQNHWGYAIKDDAAGRWGLGRIGYRFSYMDEKLFATIDPDLVGLAPVPLGPKGTRGAEINSRMQGIFAGIKEPAVRDAAWEYISFIAGKKASEISTKVMVEGGFGQFVNPKYLRMFGYSDIIRLAPKGWEETFDISIKTGKPEPYGKNCQLVYSYLTKPIQKVEEMALDNELPENEEERLKFFEKVLEESVEDTNKKMIGYIPPEEMRIRRTAAVALLICIVVSFFFIFRKIIRAFTPPDIAGVKKKSSKKRIKKYFVAYLILLPALLSIALWQYFPLLMGSKMAFQDYQIMGGSSWVGIDNFANILWDAEWWSTVWNSVRYSVLVISLTFLPPVILAVLLQEIPRFNVFFRTVFYLPAVISGLVVIFLWKTFYAPTQYGVLNAILMKIPAIGFIGLGLLFFFILFFFGKRLLMHDFKKAGILCFLVAVFMLYSFIKFTVPMLTDESVPISLRLFATIRDPYRWLRDSGTAMVCCVIPSVWAGMGPGCLIYLAALKGVAPDFYEAADLDGATFIDKILFIVVPILKPLLIIQFVGIFIGAWKSSANILAMTGGSAKTEVAGLHIFYKAYMYLQFGQATAMAWILGFMLIGFTVYQLRILSRLEFKANT